MIRKVLRRFVAVAAATALITSGFAGAATAAGKTLTIGDVADPAPSKYDPVSYSDAQALFFESLYDQLFIRTAPASAKGVKGGLVASHTLSADKTTLTMVIRTGVKFTDGSTLDAGTVKANLDRRNDTTIPSYAKFDKGGTQEITSVTVEGNSVVVKFKAAQALAAYELSGPSGFIVSEKAAKDPSILKSAPQGSGPYKLDAAKTIKANTYRLEKQTAHWNKANYPYDTVIYKVYATSQAHANAAAAGQLDVAVQPASTSVPLLKSRKVGLLSKGGNVYFMQWWDKLGKNFAFTEDKNVRLAFLYATDRAALVNGIFKGDRPTASLAGKSTVGYSEFLDTKYTYNPTKAKQLLAASKYPTPTFEIVISANEASVHEALKQQWAKVGIKMTTKIAANGGELFAAVRTGAMGIFNFDTSNLVAWGGLMLNSFPNYQSATNAKISAALGALAADPTNKAKAEALNRACVEEGWTLPLREGYSYTGYNTKTVKALKVGARGDVWPLLTEIAPK
jgi:peptide/nickel transport system substrate-binding protein